MRIEDMLICILNVAYVIHIYIHERERIWIYSFPFKISICRDNNNETVHKDNDKYKLVYK